MHMCMWTLIVCIIAMGIGQGFKVHPFLKLVAETVSLEVGHWLRGWNKDGWYEEKVNKF